MELKLQQAILAMLLVCTISISVLAEETAPVMISLELGKDTLALGEPVYVKATITNCSDKDLVIDRHYMFGLETSRNFSLFLITTNGNERRYRTRGWEVFYGPNAKLYFLLPVGKEVTEEMFLWWKHMVPGEYVHALENLPPGEYRLYATYHLPGPKGMEGTIIYSDTARFIFLAFEEEHRRVLVDFDFLRMGGGTMQPRPILERIKESNTPYSEAAWARLISWINAPDIFMAEKALFDMTYPETQFKSYLHRDQYQLFLRTGRFHETDSLLNLWRYETPHSLLIIESEFKTLTEKERRELQ